MKSQKNETGFYRIFINSGLLRGDSDPYPYRQHHLGLRRSRIIGCDPDIDAFISAVEAQRDNKISDGEADDLVAAARAIIAMLEG